MTRDYKRRSSRKKKASSGSQPWLWLLAGFGMGLVAALALYLNMGREATDLIPRAATTTQPQSERDTDSEVIDAPAGTSASRSAERGRLQPQGDEDYSFYDLLPDFEVVVPQNPDNNDTPANGRPAAPNAVKPRASAKPGTYILQAGSFRKFADADRRKAELAFQGIESNIQQVVIENDQIWYRVYIGPTTDLNTLENHRSALRRADIDVLMLKVGK